MTELLTAAQMRAIEQAAIASGKVTGLELMERAGRGVVEAVFEEWPEMAKGPHRAVVLCGPGNNGGDGFVVARLLKDWGWEVEVFLYGDPDKLPPDARVNYERWLGMGEVVDFSRAPSASNGAALYIDALFGIGLTRPFEGKLLEWAGTRVCDFDIADRTVAIDVPSGLCSDSGREIGRNAETVLAGLTVTFHSRKVGHFLGWGPFKCGKVVVKDIGIKGSCVSACRLVDISTAGLGKADLEHKFSHGHALILSGPSGRGGAARLAARGALRIGAGVVTVAAQSDAVPEHAARLDAIMLRPVADGAGLTDLLKDGRITALCLGPGMGIDRTDLVEAALRTEPQRSLVLDADALTILSQRADLFAQLHSKCVLTPHAGEFARLFPDIAERLAASATKGPAYSKVDATRDAAEQAGCVVLFKGADTVIADQTGLCSINSAHYDRAAPWLATAGSGDVLAGFITGLLARGFNPMEAAETAAWLHVECALSFGPGLISEDIPEELPKVFRALGL